jgi:hypothetical protein
MQSFDELLQAELSKPMELKQNGVKVGQISPLEAMVKSIVTKAGKGDIAAINVVRNMTRKPTQEDADETKRRQDGDGTLRRHRGAGKAVYPHRLRRVV